MHKFKNDNSIYTILFLFDHSNEISMDIAIKKTGLNRTSILRRVEKINKQLAKYNSSVLYINKILKLNLNSDFSCIWNIDSFDYILLQRFLEVNDFHLALKIIENKYFFSLDQIKYNLKIKYNITLRQLKSFDNNQKLAFFLNLFVHTFNDYNVRLIFDDISHQDILKFINDNELVHASSYDYLLIFGYLLYEEKNEFFIMELQIKCGKKRCHYDEYVYSKLKNKTCNKNNLMRALMHLSYVHTNEICFTMRRTSFKYYDYVLNYDCNYSDNLFRLLNISDISQKYIFINFLALHYITNDVNKVNDQQIILVNVDEYAVLFYAFIKLTQEMNFNVKMISSYKYFNNEDKYSNAYVNSKLNNKYSVLPLRDENNNYHYEDFIK